jgi:hypothetical protein
MESTAELGTFARTANETTLVTNGSSTRFTASTCHWVWWAAHVDKFELVVDERSQVRYALRRFGKQRPDRRRV